MARQPAIAVEPSSKLLEDAVVAGGGRLVPPAEAEGLVWTDSDRPDALRALLPQCPAKWVQLPFAGIEEFFAAGVIDNTRVWTCAKGIYGQACAEHVVGVLIGSARRFHEHWRRGNWRKAEVAEERQAGRHVLIVGAGGIARALLPMLKALLMNVSVVSRSGTTAPGADRCGDMKQLGPWLSEADFVVLAAPYTPQTRHLMNARTLGLIRPTAWLINVARGGLVDTEALVAALKENRLGGAALDVTEPEPLPDDHPLWSFPNVLITPHTANTRRMGFETLAGLVRQNVERFACGETLEGPVFPELGY